MSRFRNTTITTIGYLSFILLLLFFNGVLFYGYSNHELISAPHDVDKTDDNKVFICTTTFGEMFNHTRRVDLQESVNPENTLHKVVQINELGEQEWQITGLAYPHEVEILPNGHLLIADTGFNRVIEVNYPNSEIIWSWEPEKINWTEVNSDWGPHHYYNNKITYDWTHLNDVDFIQYDTYDACLISLRNFDLIVEVNYTAEKLLGANNPDNIIWYFGDMGNHSLLYKQHNPDYLRNGNIMIADSLNNRIIEINRTTGEIVWEYNEDLMWPRDADEQSDGSILITDSFNCRVFKLDKATKTITWEFSRNIIIPYEADVLSNGNVLISGEYSGLVYEVNDQGRIVWQYGASIEKSLVLLNGSFLIMISFFGMSMASHKVRTIKMKKLEKSIHAIIIVLFILMMFFGALLILTYSNTITAITRWVYPRIGTSMF